MDSFRFTQRNGRSRGVRALKRSAVGVLALAAPALAAAEPSAEALFQEGRARMLEHRYAEACPKLEQSQELEPRLGTLLNLAVCHEELGKLASAWLEYGRAQAQAKAEGDATRERLARERLEALAARVPRLRVNADRGASDRIEVRLDGVPLAPERWNEDLPLDPGEHHLQATSSGHQLLDQRFTLAERDQKQLSIVEPNAARPVEPTYAPIPVQSAPPQAAHSPTRAPGIGPWVAELGAFAGIMLSDYEHPTARSAGAFTLRERTSGNLTSCSSVPCSYEMDGAVAGVAGLHVFGGYALSQDFLLGARFLLGPRLGGGMLIAIGPSAVLHAGGGFWLGASFLFGDGTAQADGRAHAPVEYEPTDSEPHELDAMLAGGLGAMLHADFVLHESPRGALVLSALPLGLFSSQGSVFAIPLAVGYRFQ